MLHFCGLLLALLAHQPAAGRPNVVVILADGQGWSDLSCNGNTNLKTPRIDCLANSGTSVNSFMVCPRCAPTRAEFLSGRYHPRTGVHDVTSGGERMNTDERTIADSFKAAGYATAVFGKWHNGAQGPYHPNARGFDEFYGFCSGHWGDYIDSWNPKMLARRISQRGRAIWTRAADSDHAGSAWRPAQRPPTEEMKVKMIDRLPSIVPAI